MAVPLCRHHLKPFLPDWSPIHRSPPRQNQGFVSRAAVPGKSAALPQLSLSNTSLYGRKAFTFACMKIMHVFGIG
jgi:hypothetical protein